MSTSRPRSLRRRAFSTWALSGAILLAGAQVGRAEAAPRPVAHSGTASQVASDAIRTMLLAGPRSAPIGPPSSIAPLRGAPRGRFAVGDSLTVGVSPVLRRAGFRIDAKVGRQFHVARGIVRGQGRRLPRNVVVALGTNGPLTLRSCRSVVRAAGPHRRVFLVTGRVPRPWQTANNRRLRQCDRSFAKGRVRIIDWHAATQGRRGLLAGDGFHLSRAGQRHFARMIDRAVDRHGR